MSTELPNPDRPRARQAREPMRPAAITGSVLALIGSAILLLSTFLPWKEFKFLGLGKNPSLWDMADLQQEFTPYGLPGVLAIASLVIGTTYFVPAQRVRLTGAVTGLLVAATALGVTIWTIKVLDDIPASPHGAGAFVAVPAIVIAIAGEITAWAGNSAPAVPLAMTVTATPAASGETNLTRQLRELAALRDQGIITEDEFQAKKRQLLGLD